MLCSIHIFVTFYYVLIYCENVIKQAIMVRIVATNADTCRFVEELSSGQRSVWQQVTLAEVPVSKSTVWASVQSATQEEVAVYPDSVVLTSVLQYPSAGAVQGVEQEPPTSVIWQSLHVRPVVSWHVPTNSSRPITSTPMFFDFFPTEIFKFQYLKTNKKVSIK
jgi:hypothetical protein